MWALAEIYGKVIGRKDSQASVAVRYNGQQYDAWVTTAPHGRKSPAFRLWYDRVLSLELKRTFLLSYMRSLEGARQENADVEPKIPFWEFLGPHRTALERMLIRDLATVLKNKREVPSKEISSYELANDKVDA